MNSFIHLGVAVGIAFSFSNCATHRSEFRPESGPPTVGMPAKLSERERGFAPELEAVLRGRGYLPVRYGAGDLALDFRIAEGPINTDTEIGLDEGGRRLAEGKGRAAGAPLIGRKGVAEKSFQRALAEFEASLPGGSSGRESGSGPVESGDRAEYVY